MTPQVSRVALVCGLLNAEEARYLVVGATSMQLWGTTRATRDIDILIEPTITNTGSLAITFKGRSHQREENLQMLQTLKLLKSCQ